jgi:hypothetical protein
MKDFNTPGSNKTWMDDGFKKWSAMWQLDNIAKLLGGKVTHCICTDKTTTHKKIIIEYGHQKKCKH